MPSTFAPKNTPKHASAVENENFNVLNVTFRPVQNRPQKGAAFKIPNQLQGKMRNTNLSLYCITVVEKKQRTL